MLLVLSLCDFSLIVGKRSKKRPTVTYYFVWLHGIGMACRLHIRINTYSIVLLHMDNCECCAQHMLTEIYCAFTVTITDNDMLLCHITILSYQIHYTIATAPWSSRSVHFKCTLHIAYRLSGEIQYIHTNATCVE